MENNRQKELIFISSMALENLIFGIEESEKGNKVDAKKYIALSWAFNSYQEFVLGMSMCDKLLNNLGSDLDEINSLHEYGREMVNYCFNIVNTVNTHFGKNEISSFKAPFEF